LFFDVANAIGEFASIKLIDGEQYDATEQRAVWRILYYLHHARFISTTEKLPAFLFSRSDVEKAFRCEYPADIATNKLAVFVSIIRLS
jgi:hypothetical protein